jgi:hypothetical protein
MAMLLRVNPEVTGKIDAVLDIEPIFPHSDKA